MPAKVFMDNEPERVPVFQRVAPLQRFATRCGVLRCGATYKQPRKICTKCSRCARCLLSTDEHCSRTRPGREARSRLAVVAPGRKSAESAARRAWTKCSASKNAGRMLSPMMPIGNG
jgi:hypothetical protein